MSATSLPLSFNDLKALATHMRQELMNKKFILLYAYNGTGKTRLSSTFKDLGKVTDEPDTLYFNAFTEDLFSWDNDLDEDRERKLKINRNSRFVTALWELEMENRIRPFLSRYADFDFRIDTNEWEVIFSRKVANPNFDENSENPGEERTETVTHIKVSRGEENIFIWCFFLAVVQLAMDGIEAFKWVKYIYIDDPVSSLDEHNVIVVANHLVQLFRDTPNQLKTVISTHHILFFNVLSNEIKNLPNMRDFPQYCLNRDRTGGGYKLHRQRTDTPFFHHVSSLVELYEAAQSDKINTHHFNTLRSVLEKTAVFHGHGHFSACIKKDRNDADGVLHQRFIDLLSHGKYSLYEPNEMGDETRDYFRTILYGFLKDYPFNPILFPSQPAVVALVSASATGVTP